MSRRELIYREGAPVGQRFVGVDPDQPEEGFYRMRLRAGGVFVAIHLRYGPPSDPITGEEMDRSWRWIATANGEPIDLERVWPQCAGDPIDEVEAAHLANLQSWGRATGNAALADPRQPINHLSSPMMF